VLLKDSHAELHQHSIQQNKHLEFSGLGQQSCLTDFITGLC